MIIGKRINLSIAILINHLKKGGKKSYPNPEAAT